VALQYLVLDNIQTVPEFTLSDFTSLSKKEEIESKLLLTWNCGGYFLNLQVTKAGSEDRRLKKEDQAGYVHYSSNPRKHRLVDLAFWEEASTS
jgi:hypothetical protein